MALLRVIASVFVQATGKLIDKKRQQIPLCALTFRNTDVTVCPCRFFLMVHRHRGKTNREQGANP